MGHQMIKIIKEICYEENIQFASYSDEYILRLEANNRVMFIYGNKFPNNDAGAEQICNDKSALSDILNYYNIPHVIHTFFNSPLRQEYYPENGIWDKLSQMLKKHHGLVCKTNNGTGGNNVYRVTNQKELEHSILTIFKSSNSLAVSPLLNITNEYRVVMVGGDFQYAFRKVRPYIIGDGQKTILELSSDYNIKEFSELPENMHMNTVLPKGQRIELTWKHNLGQGALPELVIDNELKAKLSAISQKCVEALNLGFVSIDIVEVENELSVLEINSGVMIENFSKFSEENYLLSKCAVRNAIKNYLHLDTKYYLTRKRKSHYVLPVLTKIAKSKGINIIEDKQEHNFAIFSFDNNKHFVAKDYPFNINNGGSIALCSNKSACNNFLCELGYSIPKEKYFVKKSNINISLNEIERCLCNPELNLGFTYPMVVKPNDLSQGEGVFIVKNKVEGLRYAQEAFSKSKMILLQEYCYGNEYRIVVLKGKILQAYQRLPFYIVGDGKKTINTLIQKKIILFDEYGRDKKIDIKDSRIFKHISDAGYTENSVLPNGVMLKLQDIANLSLGGESKDVLNTMAQEFSELAIAIANDFNLNLCGIDIIAKDISNFSLGYRILEINSAPGLDNYLFDKKKQEKYVEDLYSKILDEVKNFT